MRIGERVERNIREEFSLRERVVGGERDEREERERNEREGVR